MNTGRFLYAALSVVSVGAMLTACFPQAPVRNKLLAQDSSAPTSTASLPSAANATGLASGAPSANASTTSPTSPTSASTTSDSSQASGLHAALTLLEGTAEVRSTNEADFKTISSTMLVASGDTIRTGPKSTALLIFMDNTEMTIYENSEVSINILTKQDNGGISIKLKQIAGFVFQRVNFGGARANSTYELDTPQAVTTVRGTAYWAKVLPDKDMFYCVVGHVDIQPIGKTTSVGCEGITLVVSHGVPTKSVLDPSLFHGDGICDPYMGEDSLTSPQDCGNGNSTIHCGNKICEPSVGETANTCPTDCKP